MLLLSIHCYVLHKEKLLKYRKQVLDDLTGICRYQTQAHEGVLPLKIEEFGHNIAQSRKSCFIVEYEHISKEIK